MRPLFQTPPPVLIPIEGHDTGFPVARIFCVGRNYAAHAAEMGNEVDREAPWYFLKDGAHAVPAGQAPFPKGTENFHHEVELAVYLGEGGAIFGYGCALDMTRRDLQQVAKDARRPWSLAKNLEDGAVLAPVVTGWQPRFQSITLSVDGTPRQEGKLSDMVWSVPDILEHLGRYYTLRAGDVILTGTPAGVGPVEAGQTMRAEVSGLPPLEHRLTEAH
ncbi:MAG: fumarylacetoacetate hydrolase family protein [Shimia sp.]